MKKINLKAQKREVFGRKVKKLRQEGILPANVYGKKIKSQAIKVNLKDFLEVFKETGETGIIDLSLENESKSRSALVHNLQKHPVTDQPLHVDFHQVSLTEKVQVAIPIELSGEAPAVAKGGVLVQRLNEVDVEALPGDLPEKFEVDVSGFKEIGQAVAVKDLKVDKTKVKILVDDEDQLVVKIEEPAKEEVGEKPAAVEAEAGKPVEEAAAGEKPAEGKEPEKAKPEEAKEKKPESTSVKVANGKGAKKEPHSPQKPPEGKKE